MVGVGGGRCGFGGNTGSGGDSGAGGNGLNVSLLLFGICEVSMMVSEGKLAGDDDANVIFAGSGCSDMAGGEGALLKGNFGGVCLLMGDFGSNFGGMGSFFVEFPSLFLWRLVSSNSSLNTMPGNMGELFLFRSRGWLPADNALGIKLLFSSTTGLVDTTTVALFLICLNT